MDRHQPVAALDKVEHRLFFSGRQIPAIAVDGQTIEVAQLRGIQVVDVLRESYVDPHRSERRGNDFGQRLRTMVARAVAKQQHADSRRWLGSQKRRGRKRCDRAEQEETRIAIEFAVAQESP